MRLYSPYEPPRILRTKSMSSEESFGTLFLRLIKLLIVCSLLYMMN